MSVCVWGNYERCLLAGPGRFRILGNSYVIMTAWMKRACVYVSDLGLQVWLWELKKTTGHFEVGLHPRLGGVLYCI